MFNKFVALAGCLCLPLTHASLSGQPQASQRVFCGAHVKPPSYLDGSPVIRKCKKLHRNNVPQRVAF